MKLALAYTTLSVVALAMLLSQTLSLLPPHAHTPLRILGKLLSSRLAILIVANMLYCTIFVFTTVVQSLVFGPLTQTEKRSVRESVVAYLLFRLVFAGAILNPYDLRELFVWTTWFVICGTLRYIIGLSKERYTTLTTLATATEETFKRYLVLVGVITCINFLLALWCTYQFYEIGLNILSLLLFENIIILFDAIRVCCRFGLHLYGMTRAPDRVWDERGAYMFYSDFITEIAIQLTALAHLLHVWSFYGLSFTLIDLFLFMNLRSVGVTIVKRCHAVLQYRRAAREIENRYADASPAELAAVDDNCAICRDRMDSAKKLPCGHLFHRSCLRQWIEYRRICPVCRAPLSPGPAAAAGTGVPAATVPPVIPAAVAPVAAPAAAAADMGAGIDDNDADPAQAVTGIRRRHVAPANPDNTQAGAAAAPPAHPAAAAQAPLAHAAPGGVAIGGAGIGATGVQAQSLFRFSSNSWAAWLPSFSFEVVRATGPAVALNALDPTFDAFIDPQQQFQQQQPAAQPQPQQQPHPSTSATTPTVTSTTVEPTMVATSSSSSSSSPDVDTSSSSSSSTLPPPVAATTEEMESDEKRRERIWTATQKRLSGLQSTNTSSSSSHVFDNQQTEEKAP